MHLPKKNLLIYERMLKGLIELLKQILEDSRDSHLHPLFRSHSADTYEVPHVKQFRTVLFGGCCLVSARMLVPKMVKNGLNSSFVIWGQF